MHSFSKFLGTSALCTAALLTWAVPAYTQSVSSGVRGEVVSAVDGARVSGATVEIIDTRTNATNRQATQDGVFNASGLDVGGPYTVRVTAPGYKTREINNVFLTLGDPLRLPIDIEPETAGTEKVTVTGQRARKLDARGVGAAYGSKNIRDLPSVTRDIKDIVAQSPLVYQDAGTVIGGVQQNPLTIAGQNPRCNSFTFDGLPQNDSFGLNFNGYPTSRAPMPNDWIKQVQVAAAPYNTEYNDFCGGIVNVVTRTGENEVHGSAYYDYTDQDLTGVKSGSRTFAKSVFRNENYGLELSGPIIKDTLFFFVGFDRILRNTPVSIGPGEGAAAGTFATQVPGVTPQDILDITSISKTVYHFDPLSLSDKFQEDNRRFISKLNWQINDDHRAQVTYSYDDGATLTTRASNSATLPILGLPSNWYLDAEKIQNTSAQVFSNWTNAFSTEFRVGQVRVHGDQRPLGGADFPEVYVRTNGIDNCYFLDAACTLPDPDGAGPLLPPAKVNDDGYVVIGPDQFRHFNVLDYTFDIVKLTGTYEINSHVIKGGYERKMLDIFNGFVQGSDGIYRFDSIADFQNGIVASTNDTRLTAGRGREPIRYANAPDNNELSASATWGYDIDSIYAQDDWDITDSLSAMLGVRYDRFSSEGTIVENAGFKTAYGFSNTKDLDGLDIWLPRASFSYNLDFDDENDPRLVFRGGAGRYSGGAPNVWVSNSYSNNGINYVQVQGTPGQAITGGNLPAANFISQAPVSFDLFDVPDALQSLLTLQSGNGPVNALAPNFQLPSTWRASFGIDTFWDEWALSLEYLNLQAKDQLVWKDLRSVDTGVRTVADNRIIYGPNALRPNDGGRDLVLYNKDEGSGEFLMFNLAKSWDHTNIGDVDFRIGYTHSQVEDIGYATASTADSNFQQRAFVNLNEPLLARSDYERQHRFTFGTSWAYRFFGEAETRLGVFGQRMSGQPFSYTYTNNPYGGNGNNFRDLLYVPKADATGHVTATSDPNVSYAPTGSLTAAQYAAAFDNFLQQSGLIQYAGGIAPRNEFFSDWTTRVDMQIEQEVPVFAEHHVVFHIGIQNVGNLLNKDWGQFTSPTFFPTQGVVSGTVGGTCAGTAIMAGTYCYTGAIGTPGTLITTGYPSSVWQIELGVRYEF